MHDKAQVFKEFQRVLNPHGRMLIVDVEEDTGTAHFLNHFVDEYNSMGHNGEFINEQALEALAQAKVEILSVIRQVPLRKFVMLLH